MEAPQQPLIIMIAYGPVSQRDSTMCVLAQVLAERHREHTPVPAVLLEAPCGVLLIGVN